MFLFVQLNPFRDQIFDVFSSARDGRLSFEDFVDLSSAMSVNCPLPVKAAWAFRVFGKSKIKINLSFYVFGLTK